MTPADGECCPDQASPSPATLDDAASVPPTAEAFDPSNPSPVAATACTVALPLPAAGVNDIDTAHHGFDAEIVPDAVTEPDVVICCCRTAIERGFVPEPAMSANCVNPPPRLDRVADAPPMPPNPIANDPAEGVNAPVAHAVLEPDAPAAATSIGLLVLTPVMLVTAMSQPTAVDHVSVTVSVDDQPEPPSVVHATCASLVFPDAADANGPPVAVVHVFDFESAIVTVAVRDEPMKKTATNVPAATVDPTVAVCVVCEAVDP